MYVYHTNEPVNAVAYSGTSVVLPDGPMVDPGIELNALQTLDECDVLDSIKHSAM